MWMLGFDLDITALTALVEEFANRWLALGRTWGRPRSSS